jgi:nucleoside-diphosphate kinase
MEKTLAIIKPGAVARRFVGEIIGEIERSGLTVEAARVFLMSPTMAENFYGEHVGKSFFKRLIEHSSSGPVWALLLTGDDAIGRWRRLMGPTDPHNVNHGLGLRQHFGLQMPDNAVHGSDSFEAAAREIRCLTFWGITL